MIKDNPISKREASEHLWRVCFDDTESFIRLYFDHIYKDEDTILLYEDGLAVAHIEMLRYHFVLCGKILPFGYISGACTLPEYRNKGLMKKLLSEALLQMYGRGDIWSVLIPQEQWLYDYYHRAVSYVPAFSKDAMRYSFDQSLDSFVSSVYDRYTSPCGMYVYHTVDQIKAEEMDYALADGGRFYSFDRGSIFYFEDKDRLKIMGMAGNVTRKELSDFLTYYINSHPGLRFLSFVCPSERGEALKDPVNMIRVVNLEALMKIILSDYEFSLRLRANLPAAFTVDDPIIEANKLSYCWDGNTYHRVEKTDFSYEIINIDMVAEALIRSIGKGFVNLMMD